MVRDMPGPEKRLPGQSNADYGGRPDPNVAYLGTESVAGGTDPTWILRLMRAFFAWRDRRAGRGV
jgi:hypothetical protein